MLASQVDNIVQKKERIDKFFKKGVDDSQVPEFIEEFIMYSQRLIDDNPELQSIVYSILAKLSMIDAHGLGARCFDALQNYLASGSVM